MANVPFLVMHHFKSFATLQAGSSTMVGLASYTAASNTVKNLHLPTFNLQIQIFLLLDDLCLSFILFIF
jgi:hypothetical protein